MKTPDAAEHTQPSVDDLTPRPEALSYAAEFNKRQATEKTTTTPDDEMEGR